MDIHERWFNEINELIQEFLLARTLIQETIDLAREIGSRREVRALERRQHEIETRFINTLRRVQREIRRTIN